MRMNLELVKAGLDLELLAGKLDSMLFYNLYVIKNWFQIINMFDESIALIEEYTYIYIYIYRWGQIYSNTSRF